MVKDRLDRLDRAYFDIKIISLVYSDLVLKKLYFLRAINSISIALDQEDLRMDDWTILREAKEKISLALADVSKKMVDFTF